VDAPDLALKSGELNEEAEAVVEITKELAPGATPYTSAKTFDELNLSPELLKARSLRRPAQRCGRAGHATRSAKTLTLSALTPFALAARSAPHRGCTRRWVSASRAASRRRRCR
jgi:hypothetical protein